MVLESSEPKFGNALLGVGGDGGRSERLLLLAVSLFVVVIVVILGARLPSLDLLLARLGLALNDGGPALVEGTIPLCVLFLELENLLLELGLDLCVVNMNALETLDAALDVGWQRLNVAR